MVCRIKYRKGQPLGLTIYPALTFTSLPLEIREKIYRLLLLAPESIVVNPQTPRTILFSSSIPVLQPRERLACLRPLTFGLLKVNKMISAEAAAIFYHQNTFRFEMLKPQEHLGKIDDLLSPWDLLYSFLFVIGDTNRALLQSLELDISRSRAVAKEPNGTMSSLIAGMFWLRKVHARDAYPRLYAPVYDDSQFQGPSVEYISPAIEAVFRLLGVNQARLQLLLRTGFNDLPEVNVAMNGYRYGWTNEVPDHIEQMRKRFTTSLGSQAQVEVIWETSCFKSLFLSKIKRIKYDGWEVLEILDVFGPLDTRDKEMNIIATLQRNENVPLVEGDGGKKESSKEKPYSGL